MSRMIFVNLPVTDLAASMAFYEALGFSNNPHFTDATAACMVWSEAISVMLLSHDKWRSFTTRPIPPSDSSEVSLALAMDSREEVDAMNVAAAAHGGTGSAEDLAGIGRELMRPQLISEWMHHEATTVQFEGLSGVLPGYGRQKHNDWGLGLEIRADKTPHWTGTNNSPATFGHFGQAGSFLWIDPEVDLACAFLGAEPFGEVHKELWPRLNDALLAEYAG